MGSFWEKIERPRYDRQGNPMTMVKWLILLNFLAFVPQAFLRIAHNSVDLVWFGLSWQGLKSFCLWQPLTFIVEHGDIWPLICFLITLWFLGRDLEYHLGSGPLLKLYVFSALTAAACFLLLDLVLKEGSFLFGSEAAFLAILVAYATLWPDRPLMFDVSAKWWAVIFVTATAYFLAVYRGPTFLGHLGGAAVGYLFIKLSGYSECPAWLDSLASPWRKLRQAFNRKSPRGTLARESDEPTQAVEEDFISKEVDPILEKIAKHGMQSLTRRERKILEAAREKMDKRT